MGLKLSALSVEITRKCNKKCVHCMQGEAQNLSISKEIIDKLFKDIDDCKTIYFGGGEVLLEIDLIDYFVDKLVNSKWNTTDIQLTTNGTILDDKIVDIYDKFCKSGEERLAILRISDDVFHDKGEIQNAFAFYNPLIDERNRNYDDKKEMVCWFASKHRDSSDLPVIIYSGRGKDFVDNNRSIFTPLGAKPVIYPYLYNHRIKIENDTVCCTLGLRANGNVVFDEHASYEIDDKVSMGNILKDNFTNILLNHNDKCLLRCEEASKITYGEKYREFVPNLSENQRISLNVISMVYKKVLKTRELAKEIYPFVPAQDVIEYLPTPTDFEVSTLVENIYNRYCNALQANDVINKLDNDTMQKFVSDYKELPKRELDYRLKLFVARIILQDENLYVSSHNIFGTKDDIVSSQSFAFLSILNDKYKSGLLSFTNDKVFFCNGA